MPFYKNKKFFIFVIGVFWLLEGCPLLWGENSSGRLYVLWSSIFILSHLSSSNWVPSTKQKALKESAQHPTISLTFCCICIINIVASVIADALFILYDYYFGIIFSIVKFFTLWLLYCQQKKNLSQTE